MVSAPFPEGPFLPGLTVQPLADFSRQAWRNGGGTTRTLAHAADDGWRISLADIAADGPYSRFQDVDRISLIVSGAGVTLGDGVRTVVLAPGVAVPFDGDVAWDATLAAGPSVALNAMARRGRFAAKITVLGPAPTDVTTVPSGAFALILTLDGGCRWFTGPEQCNEAHGTLGAATVLMRDFNGPALVLEAFQTAQVGPVCAALVTIEPIQATGATAPVAD